MSKITDYAFLFQKTFGTSGENVIGSFQLSQLNSSSVQSQLKAAGYTLEKYERIYRQAFYDAAKKADPNWEIGKPIKDGALDSVTRELAESGKSPASGEKTFYTAETPKVYQIFTTDNMLWTGGNGTGLSYCLKYADDSTDENPVVLHLITKIQLLKIRSNKLLHHGKSIKLGALDNITREKFSKTSGNSLKYISYQ